MKRAMRVPATLCLALTLQIEAGAQNLIPNASFEYYNWECTQQVSNIFAVYAWSLPDCAQGSGYYNACNTDHGNFNFGVPSNYWGIEEAADGVAYLGIFTYKADFISPDGHAKVYPMVQFWEPLEAGQEYCIRTRLSLMDSSSYRTSALHCFLWYGPTSTCGNNDEQWAAASAVTFNTEQVGADGWTTLEGSFIASGGETTLTIGDFSYLPGVDTTFIAWRQEPYYAAYYLDDIYLGTCDISILENDGTDMALNVHPNPVRPGEKLRLSLASVYPDRVAYQIIDMQGRIVNSGLLGSGDTCVSTDRLPNGTYLIKVTTNDRSYQARFTVE